VCVPALSTQQQPGAAGRDPTYAPPGPGHSQPHHISRQNLGPVHRACGPKGCSRMKKKNPLIAAQDCRPQGPSEGKK